MWHQSSQNTFGWIKQSIYLTARDLVILKCFSFFVFAQPFICRLLGQQHLACLSGMQAVTCDRQSCPDISFSNSLNPSVNKAGFRRFAERHPAAKYQHFLCLTTEQYVKVIVFSCLFYLFKLEMLYI